MRLGVTGKIFLAYALVLAVFAANAWFTVATLGRARQRVVANQAYLALQVAVDEARASLSGRDAARTGRPDPNSALALATARRYLGEARTVVDRFLDQEPSAAMRPQFETFRRQIGGFQERVDDLVLALPTAQVEGESRVALDYWSRHATLANLLGVLGKAARVDGKQLARQLSLDEDYAFSAALGLGVAGLLVALAGALAMLHTLRPLRSLRTHAREVAAGDYARRTGVSSRDEIGQLAREFDAMAAAIEERETRLIRSERLATVGRMAAQITHEIRNPLASIGLNTELLGDEVGARPEARKLVDAITSEVDRLTEITETYLRFARLPKPRLEREDLAALVASAVEFARAEVSQAGIALETRLGPGLPDVACDEGQVRQALLNLVRNAREAMPGGGRMIIEVAAAAGDRVRLSVTDTGPGIAEEHVGKVFDPFFSTKEKGTGLGLALVQQIAAEHGGRIEVRSRPGEGTTFALTLPALAARTSVSREAPAAMAAGDRPEESGDRDTLS